MGDTVESFLEKVRSFAMDEVASGAAVWERRSCRLQPLLVRNRSHNDAAFCVRQEEQERSVNRCRWWGIRNQRAACRCDVQADHADRLAATTSVSTVGADGDATFRTNNARYLSVSGKSSSKKDRDCDCELFHF